MGESWIVRDNESVTTIRGNKSRSRTARGITGEFSAFEEYLINRKRIKINLFSDEKQLMQDDEMYCAACNLKRVSVTKEKLLKLYVNPSPDVFKKINGLKPDVSYMFCNSCGDWCSELDYKIEPNSDTVKSTICWQKECMDRMKGTVLNLNLKKVCDEWRWVCSSCGFQQSVPRSYLKKTYKEDAKTFVLSQPLRSAKKKSNMTKEEIREASALLGGRVTSKVDERDIPPPGY